MGRVRGAGRLQARRALVLLGLAFVFACGFSPSAALAATADAASVASPCVPTEEQLAAYEADGTLAERQAYQESLGNSRPSSALVEQALARQNAADGISLLSAGAATKGMATTGSAHVLAIRVSFPDMQFDEGDTAEALQAAIGPVAEGGADTGDAANYPYESLSAYYRRSSYGKLTITGEVFTYTAQHERDYYTNDSFMLFDEAISALDAELDLARFDANSDGYFDGVYLRFAGADTGWGSTWWSSCPDFSYTTTTYEGGSLRVARGVLLSENDVRTLIHETGHVLGLPDYYSYDKATAGRTGMLVSDMMNDNQGDHCGFSKWMLGWLDSSDVTRVVVTEDGITASRGGAVIATAAAGESLDQVLGAFTSSDVPQTGGIIVLSIADEGMFSSYYVLQYDHYAGNQSVSYTDSTGTHELPQGFRMYRVQASLNDSGTDFVKLNSSGNVHDQLIELVDPDESSWHSNGLGVYSVTTAEGYGCMLYAGSSVTPETYPSTNFYESASFGFTGICVDVLSCGDAEGAVRISYSDTLKPSPAKDISLTQVGEGISASGSLELKASSDLRIADYTKSPQFVIDGTNHATQNVVANGTSVTVSYLLDAESISASSSCEIVFPAGYFAIGYADGKAITSPELHVDLAVNERLAGISASGLYADTLYFNGGFTTSGLYTLPSGAQGYAMLVDGAIRLCTVSAADDSTLSWVKTSATGPSMPGDCASFEAVALDDGRVFVVVAGYLASTANCYWIDAETGVVEASCSVAGAAPVRVASSGSSVVLVLGRPSELSGTLLVSLSADDAGVVSEHRGWTKGQEVYAASSSSLAAAITDEAEVGVKLAGVKVVDASAIVNALANNDYTEETVSEGGDVFEKVAGQTIAVAEARTLLGVATNGSSYALLMSGESTEDGTTRQIVALYDASGVQTARSELDGNYGQIRMAEHGAVAVSRVNVALVGVGSSTTLLFDAALASAKVFGTAANSAGGWLADGRWYNVNEGLRASVFSEDGEYLGNLVHYNITEQIDKTPSDPDDPDEPDTPSGPTTPESPNVPAGSDGSGTSDDTLSSVRQAANKAGRTKMPATGDDSAIVCAAAMACASGLMLAAARLVRGQR